MEQVNIGLGEAIAEGTNANSNFGSPITQGIGIGQRNILLEAQREEKKRAKQLAMQEKMAKYSSFDPSKWYDKGVGQKAKEAIDKKLPIIYQKVQSGDEIGRIQAEQELSNEVAMYKLQDADIKKIRTAPQTSATTIPAQKRYEKMGVDGILQDALNYPPMMAVAQVNPETGDFNLRNVPKVNLSRDLGKLVEPIIPTKKGQVVGNQQYFNVDVGSPEYKAAKVSAINSYLTNDEKAMGLMVTDDFKEFYDKQLAASGIPREEAIGDNEFAEQALAAYVGMKFDETASKKTANQVIRKVAGSGASGGSKFTFIEKPDGGKLVNFRGLSNVKTIIDGNIEGEEGKQSVEIIDPIIYYNPSSKSFTVKGKKSGRRSGTFDDAVVNNVDPEILKSKFDLKESDLISKFGAQGYGKGAVKTAQPKGKKLSFPKWKAQNPNGTNEQFKQYLKS